MNYKELIVKSGLEMIGSGLTVGTWGNISARDPKSGLVYLTPSNMNYAKIQESDIVVCDLDGNIVEGHRKPSIEKDLHLKIYKNRQDVNAVVHTHPIYSTVFSCMGEDIPPIIDEAAQALFGPSRRADYALPGSEELADNCVKALGEKAMSCLLQSHGAVCVGCDMASAFKAAQILEMTAEVYYRIRAVGGTPIPISQENMDAMMNMVKNSVEQK